MEYSQRSRSAYARCQGSSSVSDDLPAMVQRYPSIRVPGGAEPWSFCSTQKLAQHFAQRDGITGFDPQLESPTTARENRGTIEQVERCAVTAAERLCEVDGGRERAFGAWRGQSARLPLALDVEQGADSGGLQGK